jgi:hypothetical protein
VGWEGDGAEIVHREGLGGVVRRWEVGRGRHDTTSTRDQIAKWRRRGMRRRILESLH